MSRDFRRFIICVGAGALLVGVLAVVKFTARAYYSKELTQSCRPCPDPAACRPFELKLELSKPWPKVNSAYAVWHRVRLTNVSCLKFGKYSGDLNSVVHSGMSWSDGGPGRRRLRRSGLYFKIWDSKGREIRPYDVSPPSSGTSQTVWDMKIAREWEESGLAAAVWVPSIYQLWSTTPETEFGDIVPYRLESRAPPGIVRSSGVLGGMVPGGWIESGRTIIEPYRWRLTTVSELDTSEGQRHFRIDRVQDFVPAPPGVVKPPEGFQVLENYTFNKPGKYRIAAFYEEKGDPDIPGDKGLDAYRIYPRFNALDGIMARILGWLVILPWMEMAPPHEIMEIPVLVQSDVLEFEVRP